MEFDLVVAGGGPAGAATALAAASKGLSVLVLEKAGKGRDKFCGGGVTVLARKHLAELGAKEVEEAFDLWCEGHVLVLPGERVLVDAVRGLSYAMVRRRVFDAKLLEIAEAAGARVVEGARVEQVGVGPDGVSVVDSKGGRYTGRYLVVATGAGDKLPERVGFPSWRASDLGHCWGAEAPYDSESQVAAWRSSYGFTPIFLMFGFVTYGYFWVFPKKGHMNVGMGTTLTESMKLRAKHSEAYRAGLELARKLRVLDRVEPFKVEKSALIPGRPRGWSKDRPRGTTWSAEKRALLVGDAAGFVHPLTGEGLSGALGSGRLAAEAVKQALDAGDPSRLAAYEEAWWREFGRDMFEYGLRLARLLYSSPTVQRLGLLALMADEKAVKLLSRLLYRADARCSEELYNYVVKRLPLLLLKAPLAGEKRSYSEL
uniref:Geranylgeranyl reductase family protein n=1 Tax=Thermofilum pendens TaxID=2269 RepID=A0A7J3X5H6_THEPE